MRLIAGIPKWKKGNLWAVDEHFSTNLFVFIPS